MAKDFKIGDKVECVLDSLSSYGVGLGQICTITSVLGRIITVKESAFRFYTDTFVSADATYEGIIDYISGKDNEQRCLRAISRNLARD